MGPLAPSDPRVLKRARALERLSQMRAAAVFEPRPSVAPRPDPADIVDTAPETDVDHEPAPAPAANRKAAFQRAVRLNRQGIPTLVDERNELVAVDDVLADWERLRDAGTSVTDAADRLHLVRKQLVHVLDRALAAGDQRGSREPFARDALALGALPRRPRRTLRLRRELHDEAVAS